MSRFSELAYQQRGPQASREMPRYQSHKKVWALKIAAIEIVRPTIADLEAILDGQSDGPS